MWKNKLMDDKGVNMRVFIVKVNIAPSNPAEIDLNSLVSSRRIDVICRYISATFCLSNDIRRDTLLYLCFDRGDITVLFDGSKITEFYSDEKRIARMLRDIFVYKNNVQTQLEVFSGIYLIKKGFRDIIKEFKNHSNELVYLHKDGVNVWDLDLFGNEIWVLGDQRGLGKDNAFVRVQAKLVSVSPYVLHAEHCISIVHNKIDNEDVVRNTLQ